jgi:uncharacterized protein
MTTGLIEKNFAVYFVITLIKFLFKIQRYNPRLLAGKYPESISSLIWMVLIHIETPELKTRIVKLIGSQTDKNEINKTAMDIIWIIAGAIFILFGFISSFLPVIPGPPLSYIGLLFMQLTANRPFDTSFLIIWALVVTVIFILDNLIPIYGTKKFGGSPAGMLGCIAGLIIGVLFFPPVGVIIGPIAGAFTGEIMTGKKSDKAFRAAFGAFAGYVFSTLLKVTICAVLAYYFVMNL